MNFYDRMGELGAPSCIALTVGDFYDNQLFDDAKNLTHLIALTEQKYDITLLLDMVVIADSLLATEEP